MFDSSSGVQQIIAFVGYMDSNAEIVFTGQKLNYLFTQMVYVDNNFSKTSRFKF